MKEIPMNTIQRCLLVALFSLVTRSAFAAPGAATLIAPSGDVTVGVPITFSWQAVPESTWYLLWVGKGTPTAFVMEQWYSADQAGCASGGGTCTITLTVPVNAGPHTWFIQTWAAGVVGPWSPGMQFVVTASHWSSKLPNHRRFTLVLDNEAVLDNETGLVWQRTLGAAGYEWKYARFQCADQKSGQRGGWRLPTISELRSLVDFTRDSPAWPVGHPFIGDFTRFYWSETPYGASPGSYFTISFTTGSISIHVDSATNFQYLWCVRAAPVSG